MLKHHEQLWCDAQCLRRIGTRIEQGGPRILPTIDRQAVPWSERVDLAVVCEDPVGPHEARILGHDVDPAVWVTAENRVMLAGS